jgi:hypothetical protein
VSNGLNRQTIAYSLVGGFLAELLVIIFNLLSSPDPPRWLGAYKELVWLQEPGDYLDDHQILPGGLLAVFVLQGLIYSIVVWVAVVLIGRRRECS